MSCSIKHKKNINVHLEGACITSTSREKRLGITKASDNKCDKHF